MSCGERLLRIEQTSLRPCFTGCGLPTAAKWMCCLPATGTVLQALMR